MNVDFDWMRTRLSLTGTNSDSDNANVILKLRTIDNQVHRGHSQHGPPRYARGIACQSEAADRSHHSLRYAGPRLDPKTAIFYGDGIAFQQGAPAVNNRTDVSFDWNNPSSGDGSDPRFFRDFAVTQRMATKRPRGDGTVPALSAFGRIAGARVVERRAFAVEHASCFSDPIFQLAVENQVFQFSIPVFFPGVAKGP